MSARMHRVRATLTNGRTVKVSEISFFEDRSVGIGLHVDSFVAKYEDTGEEIDYDLSDEDVKIIDEQIWAAKAEDDNMRVLEEAAYYESGQTY